MRKILFLIFVICIFAGCDEVEQAYEEATSSPAQEIPAIGQVERDKNFIIYRYDPAFNSSGVIHINYVKIFKLISKDFEVIEMNEASIKDFIDLTKTIHKNSLHKNQYICLIKTNTGYKYINLNSQRAGSLEDSISDGPIFVVTPNIKK